MGADIGPLASLKLRRALSHSGVVAYPTEAVFGLGCAPDDRVACERLLALKGRPVHKGLILIAASFEQLEPYVAPVSPALLRRALAQWPGPVTWIFPASGICPWWVSGGRENVAVRVTAHPFAAALCNAWGGPLVSTSANRSGRPPARTALAARRQFPQGLDIVFASAVGGAAAPSLIRDLRSGETLRA